MIEFEGTKYLTLEEVADRLQKSEQTVRMLIRGGKITAFTGKQRKFFVAEDDLEVFIQAQISKKAKPPKDESPVFKPYVPGSFKHKKDDV
jgi:excisionase family DNA binding protein